MYARIVSATIQRDMMREAIRIYRDEIDPVAKQQAGNLGGYFLTDRDKGKAISISLWESKADMLAGEESNYLQEQIMKMAELFTSTPIAEHFEVSVGQMELQEIESVQ